MKKIVLGAAALLLSFISYAQPTAGNLNVTGILAFTTSGGETSAGGVTADNAKTMNFTFAPSIGYNLSDNMTAGLIFGFGSNKTTQPDNGNVSGAETKSSFFGAGVFLKYHVQMIEKLTFSPQVITGFISNKTENTNGGTTVTSPEVGTFALGIMPGLTYAASENWMFDFTAGFLGFTTSNSKTPGNPGTEVKTNNFGLMLSGVAMNIGVTYSFGI